MRERCARCQLAETPEVSISALLELYAAPNALPPVGCSSTIGCEKHREVREGGGDGGQPRSSKRERGSSSWRGRGELVGRIPAQIRVQVRCELTRLLMRLASAPMCSADD